MMPSLPGSGFARDRVNGGTAAERWWDEHSEGFKRRQPVGARIGNYLLLPNL